MSRLNRFFILLLGTTIFPATNGLTQPGDTATVRIQLATEVSDATLVVNGVRYPAGHAQDPALRVITEDWKPGQKTKPFVIEAEVVRGGRRYKFGKPKLLGVTPGSAVELKIDAAFSELPPRNNEDSAEMKRLSGELKDKAGLLVRLPAGPDQATLLSGADVRGPGKEKLPSTDAMRVLLLPTRDPKTPVKFTFSLSWRLPTGKIATTDVYQIALYRGELASLTIPEKAFKVDGQAVAGKQPKTPQSLDEGVYTCTHRKTKAQYQWRIERTLDPKVIRLVFVHQGEYTGHGHYYRWIAARQRFENNEIVGEKQDVSIIEVTAKNQFYVKGLIEDSDGVRVSD